MPAAISWETVENAIQAWVVAISGLPGRRCIWTYQGGKMPSPPYITLQIDGVRGIGQPWKKREYDAATDELVIKVTQHQTALLTLQYFADNAGTPGTTGREPISTLTDVMAGMDLYEYEIDEAGAGVGEASPVQYVAPSGNGILSARSIATVVLHLQAELERRENYVARWHTTVQAKDSAGATIDSRSFWTPRPSSFSSGFSAGFELGGAPTDNG